MKKSSSFLSLLRMLGYLTQFGLSVIMPPLLLVFLGYWLSERYGIGAWLPIGLLVCGLISSGCSIYRFFQIFKTQTADPPYSEETTGCTEPPEITENPQKKSSSRSDVPEAKGDQDHEI